MKKGYSLQVNNEQIIELPDTTNFDWRIEQDGAAIQHMYYGEETGDGVKLNITLSKSYEVRVSSADPRCYIYIK
ncbi:MAG: hypothetical protein MUD12_16790 [Spirochaetes bacterium]|jgi:hypothetical protein|nr:hypothetical protein [Spirochaetota bacterium]